MTAPDGLQLGFGVPTSGAWATAENQARIARRAEQLGYHSLWTFSRLLFPLNSGDAEWTSDFEPAFAHGAAEPIVTMAFLAGVTERIRLGFSVINAPFLAPAVLGKQLIQLDRVSGGRIDAGIAQGWSAEEYRAIGIPMERRVARTLEYVKVLQAMWENDQAEFQGEFTELPRTRVRPRPVQDTFPLLLGGSNEHAFERAGRLAQGWVSPGFISAEEIATAATGVRDAARRAGRDPQEIRIVVRATVFLGAAGDSSRALFTGSAEQIAADLRQARDAGATEVFLDFNFDPRIVGADVDAKTAVAEVEEALEFFAPGPAADRAD
ncbi:TIGR03619 family F420-dependent LLM class oxidoreductase [Kitasatospora sp. NBC_01266]|uniref:TIGR03619 family F420-dependent LLM class oxidoreductase n=1 Tax=Kitasatospora sp. NBC_01266 TaxID=2903572 RepID=UPI002E31CB65|nr:TIGR03619 family F420-dependent LLM class oxidoreductase [Kitasatospora sp. NBC_01266]